LRARDLPVRRVLPAVRTLCSPSSGLLGQGVRYGLAGGAVALVYLSTTTLFAEVVRIPFQIALAIGFCVALVVHFTLQRLFVWSHQEEFALPLHHQAGRYLTFAGTQYGLTIASTALLPAALGVSTEIVYLVTAAVLASTNFLVFRHGIFHADKTPSFEQDRADQDSVDQPTHSTEGELVPFDGDLQSEGFTGKS
jgi:putative flippase GtrA